MSGYRSAYDWGFELNLSTKVLAIVRSGLPDCTKSCPDASS